MSDPRIIIARALYADGKGIGYKKIGKRLGVSRDKARDWVRPDRRARLHKKLGRCRACEEPMHGPSGYVGVCKRCRAERDREVDEMIRVLWPSVETLDDLGAEVGLTAHAVSMRAQRMRRAGVHLAARPRGRQPAIG